MLTTSIAIPDDVPLAEIAKQARPRLRSKILKLAACVPVVFTAAEASDLRLLIALMS